MTYYKELLSGNPDDYAIYAQTSFRPEMRLLAQATDVSSKYTRRGEEEYRRIAEYISTAVKAREGNYMAFFPSYDFMDKVAQQLSAFGGFYSENDENRAFELTEDGDKKAERNKPVRVLKQKSRMSEDEREAFLSTFDEVCETKVGLCVMGGIFAEGIDLADEKLIGAIVVGTGLPMINTESEIAKKHFDGQEKDGFAYAYRYPGMNKVMQAAGRVIRKDSDRGVILLLDERFSYSEYRRLFPKEWEDVKIVKIGSLQAELENFWSGAGANADDR